MTSSIGNACYANRIALYAAWRLMKTAVMTTAKLVCVLALCILIPESMRICGQQKPKASSDDFSEAKTLLAQHRLSEATTAVLDRLKQHPSSVEGYNLLGIIESNQQDYAAAAASFQKALTLNPRSTRTHNNLGNLYVSQRRGDLAESEFRTALRNDSANSEANYSLGVLLLMKGSPASAIAHFERVHPITPEARFNLVRAYLQAKRTRDALRVAAELSEQSKNEVSVHFSLGVLLASEKLYKPAQLELERADALQPETFEILYNLGQALLRNGYSTKSQVVLSRALKLKPESPEAMYLLAQAYTNQSRPLDALDVLVRAHKLAPQNVDVIFLMAHVSMSQNYYEDAIPLLQSGLQIAPQRADLLAALGESYFMAGKVEKAIDQFNRLLEIDHSARSFAFLGLSYRNLGRFNEAKQYFQQGLTLDPQNSMCLFNMGFILERQGDAAGAESYFQQALQSNPEFPDALLELANMRIAAMKFSEAEELLRKYVRVSRDPAAGYYKLAMVERSLHETAAANRDLNVFKNLSKRSSAEPLPYEHLFDYLDNRSRLDRGARAELDVATLLEQVKTHPDQPQDLYLLAEAYLRAGNLEDARNTIVQLDQISADDYRTLAGTGVLLARYHLYDDAIRHFQTALAINPNSDEVKFDLANAYFRKPAYQQALQTARQVSEPGRKDDAYLTLLADIYVHLGDTAQAATLLRDAIDRNPDNDQNYLSLALIQLRAQDIDGAQNTLSRGKSRIPASGKLYWGLGLASAMRGQTSQAAQQLQRAIELLPEWGGGYSTLGVFYYQIGQIDKAREVLNRFKGSSASGSLDVAAIEQQLDQSSSAPAKTGEVMTAESKEQFLQFALSLADKTL